MRIKGITITLCEKVKKGTDPFGKTIYEEIPVNIENVLIYPTSSTEVATEIDLTGAKEIYTLAIPKGDSHNWTDSRVLFFGQSYRAVAPPIQGLDSLIPGDWNKKVTVARYE